MLDAPRPVAPAPTNEALKEQEMALARNGAPATFRLRAPLLAQGRSDTMLAATDDLTLRLKVYASGGENALHAHPGEDHGFVVLQGAARFFGPDGETVTLGRHEGIMLPKGSFYRFHATGDEPLVLLRVGSPNYRRQRKPARIAIDGREMKGDAKENKRVPAIVRKGEFFG